MYLSIDMNFKAWLAIILILLLSSCGWSDFVRGEAADANRKFHKAKTIITNISFKGLVLNKSYCNDCDNRGKYTLTIRLFMVAKKPDWYEQQYPPYYYFEKDTLLKLSVNELLYNFSKQNDTVVKQTKSDDLIVNKRFMPLISKDTSKWIP